MDYSSYAFVGVVVAGIAANKLVDYRNRRIRGQAVQLLNERTRQITEARLLLDKKFSKAIKSIEDIS